MRTGRPRTRPALGARASGPHLGWHSRGYHPHFDAHGLVQSITFRLHDSVPAALLDRWRSELALTAVRRYIRENPVNAGLCDRAEEWRFGSGWGEERAGGPRTQN